MMKVLMTLLSASAVLSTFAFAEPVRAAQEIMHNEKVETHTEMHNRFHDMKTDKLLELRGNMHEVKEREQLHNELMSRQHTMTEEQKRKFDRRPDKVSNEMGMQGKGNAYGQGQGMMQGQGKKMMEGGSGMGGGKGGR